MPHKDPAARRAYKKQYRLDRWTDNPDAMRTTEARWRRQTQSRPEFKEYNRQACIAFYRRDPDWNSFQVRLRSYGITLDQYHARLEAQDFQCAICGADDLGRTNGKVMFFVDHCHKTGRFRGLLCHGCNIGLGGFKDNPAALTTAIEYLKRSADMGCRWIG